MFLSKKTRLPIACFGMPGTGRLWLNQLLEHFLAKRRDFWTKSPNEQRRLRNPTVKCCGWGYTYWLVVDLPLWKILVSWEILFPIYGKQRNVPNHQSAYKVLIELDLIAIGVSSEWVINRIISARGASIFFFGCV